MTSDDSNAFSDGSLPVIACELSALTERQRRRRAELAEMLRVGVCEVTGLPSGYAFHFARDPVTVRKIEELIAFESLCCAFLTMATRLDAAGDRLVLEITGGPGVREFVSAQFGIGGSLSAREDS